MKNETFKAGVGMSRKWDAREAGREVAESTLDGLQSDPNFFLVFSTIHYEKQGGLQELLNGVWDILPEKTPLIGGTVAGFINPHGCFTRGSSAIAVSYPHMNIAAGIGENTRGNPRRAAKQCSTMIKKDMTNNGYDNRLIVDLVSSGLVPKLPGIGRTMIIPSKVVGSSTSRLMKFSTEVLHTGVGRQDEVFRALVNNFPEYSMISGGATDDINQLRNYQFFGNKTYSNSLCAMAIDCDFPIKVNTTHGLKVTNKTFRITSLDKTKRVIKSIDGKSAVKKLFEILNLSDEDLNEHIFKKIFFLPIGFQSKDGKLIPSVAGIFLGDYFLVIFQVENDEGKILNLSGLGLINAIDENFEICQGKPVKLALFSSCGMRLLALGKEIYNVHKKLTDKLNGAPFLLYYVSGESTYSMDQGINYGNYTFNSAFFM